MAEPLTSPSFPAGARCDRSLAEMRRIRARRAVIADSYRADGFDESYIAAHVTDDLAEKMLAYDDQAIDAIASLFGGRT